MFWESGKFNPGMAISAIGQIVVNQHLNSPGGHLHGNSFAMDMK
jgi:hypothetical protein